MIRLIYLNHFLPFLTDIIGNSVNSYIILADASRDVCLYISIHFVWIKLYSKLGSKNILWLPINSITRNNKILGQLNFINDDKQLKKSQDKLIQFSVFLYCISNSCFKFEAILRTNLLSKKHIAILFHKKCQQTGAELCQAQGKLRLAWPLLYLCLICFLVWGLEGLVW